MVRDGDGETLVRKPSRSRVIGQAKVSLAHLVLRHLALPHSLELRGNMDLAKRPKGHLTK